MIANSERSAITTSVNGKMRSKPPIIKSIDTTFLNEFLHVIFIEFVRVNSAIFFFSSSEAVVASKASNAKVCGAFQRIKSSVSYHVLRRFQADLAVSLDIPSVFEDLMRKSCGWDKLNLKATAMRTSRSY